MLEERRADGRASLRTSDFLRPAHFCGSSPVLSGPETGVRLLRNTRLPVWDSPSPPSEGLSALCSKAQVPLIVILTLQTTRRLPPWDGPICRLRQGAASGVPAPRSGWGASRGDVSALGRAVTEKGPSLRKGHQGRALRRSPPCLPPRRTEGDTRAGGRRRGLCPSLAQGRVERGTSILSLTRAAGSPWRTQPRPAGHLVGPAPVHTVPKFPTRRSSTLQTARSGILKIHHRSKKSL